jgi:hypothetical protein
MTVWYDSKFVVVMQRRRRRIRIRSIAGHFKLWTEGGMLLWGRRWKAEDETSINLAYVGLIYYRKAKAATCQQTKMFRYEIMSIDLAVLVKLHPVAERLVPVKLSMNSVSVNIGKNVSYTVIKFAELYPTFAILAILFISNMGPLCIPHTELHITCQHTDTKQRTC